MAKKFSIRALLGMAQREDATTDELIPTIDEAEADLVAARSGVIAAEEAYQSGLLSDNDSMLRKLAEARTEASIRVDRAAAVVVALKDRLAQARVREEEAVRVQKYQDAQRQADEARRALAEMYPMLAGQLVQLLTVVAEAEKAVRQVNDDLPKSAAPLPHVEGSVRDVEGTPQQIISEQDLDLWCWPGEQHPHGLDQTKVHVNDDGSGFIKRGSSQAEYLVLRRFKRVITREAVRASSSASLAGTITLPGLSALDAPFWQPPQRQIAVPPFWGPNEKPSPTEVLAQVKRLDGQATGTLPNPVTQEKLMPLAPLDPKAAAEEKKTARQRSGTGLFAVAAP